MNIFRVFNTILYPLFVYVLFFSKWILVESNATLGGSNPLPGSGTKTGVDLSLKAKEATGQFNYEKSGQIVTYTAKDNYAFKSVKTGKKGETVVWTTSNPNEYATKVVLDGKGKKKKKVTIHLPNNTTKVYKRDGKGKSWTTVSQQSNQPTVQSTGSVTPASGSSQPVSGSSQSASEGTHGGGASQGANEGTRGGTTQSLGNEGSGTHTGGDGNGGGTTPPASEGSGNDASAGGDGSSATNPPSSGGEGTQERDPASSTNDLMQKFGTLVGKELQPGEYPNDFKFFKADPNDANSTVELTKSEYKVKFDVDEHIYVFYDLNCTLIKCGNDVVWQYGSSTDGSTTPDPTKTGSSTDGSTIPDGTNSSSTTPDPKKSGSTTPDGTKSDPKSNTKYPKGMSVEPDLMFIYFDDHTKVYSKKSEVWKSSGKVENDLSKLKVKVPDKKGS